MISRSACALSSSLQVAVVGEIVEADPDRVRAPPVIDRVLARSAAEVVVSVIGGAARGPRLQEQVVGGAPLLAVVAGLAVDHIAALAPAEHVRVGIAVEDVRPGSTGDVLDGAEPVVLAGPDRRR